MDSGAPAGPGRSRLPRTASRPLGLFAQQVATRVAAIAAGGLLVFLLARGLDPDEYGVYAILTTTYVFGNLLVGLNLSANLGRRVPGTDEASARRILLTMMSCEVGVATLIVAGFVVAGLDTWVAARLGIARYGFELRVLLGIILLDLVAGSALQYMLARKWFTRANVVTLLRGSALALLLALWRLGGGAITLRTVVLCWAAGIGLATLVALAAVSFPRVVTAGFDRSLIRPAIPFGLMVAFQSLTFYFLKLADRYFLAASASLHEIGIYSFAYSVANIVYSVTALAVMSLYYPHIVEAHNQADPARRDRLLAQMTRVSLGLVSLASVATIFAARFMVSFARPDYIESAPVIPWLLVVLIAVVAGYPSSVMLIVEGRLAATVACGLVGLGIALVGDLVFIPRYSYWGAIAAAVAGYAAVAVAQNTMAGTWSTVAPRNLALLASDLRQLLGRH